MADQVAAFTFHLQHPTNPAERVTVYKGTARGDVPDALVDQLGEHAWTDAPAKAAGPDVFGDLDTSTGQVDRSGASLSGGNGEGLAPPPKGGPGSGEAEWRQFAEAVGVDVPEGASRDDVIAEVERRGLA